MQQEPAHPARASSRLRLDDPLLDRYLEFVEARARHNTLLAAVSDLRAFFAVVAKPGTEVTTADVLDFIAAQRRPRGDGRVVRLADGEAGLSARTIRRRLSSVSGLFAYLSMCGEIGANPVPRGLATRRPGRTYAINLGRRVRMLVTSPRQWLTPEWFAMAASGGPRVREAVCGSSDYAGDDMPQPRQRLALLLVAALATFALSAAATDGGRPSAPQNSADAAFAIDGNGDSLTARLTGSDRRDASQRSMTQRFVLLAIAASLLALHALGRPRARRSDQPGPLRVSLWSPSVGRAPPVLQLAIV